MTAIRWVYLGHNTYHQTKPVQFIWVSSWLDPYPMSGWWFGTFFIFPFSWEFHHPNWRTHIFQRGRSTTNQMCFVLMVNGCGHGSCAFMSIAIDSWTLTAVKIIFFCPARPPENRIYGYMIDTVYGCVCQNYAYIYIYICVCWSPLYHRMKQILLLSLSCVYFGAGVLVVSRHGMQSDQVISCFALGEPEQTVRSIGWLRVRLCFQFVSYPAKACISIMFCRFWVL